jgi:anti-sigma B factor antagonist
MTDLRSFHQESVPAGRDCAVLRVTGEIDAYTAPQVREQVSRLVGDGTRHVVADLRGVNFLNSTGLGVLVGSLKRLRDAGGSLTIVAGPGRILKIFEITGLVRAFALYPSVPEAIATHPGWQAALAAEGHDAASWCRQRDLM